jgi:ATP-dependent Clp protease adapter protein ClpS
MSPKPSHSSPQVQSPANAKVLPDLAPNEPRHYKVVLINDDFTTMEFVVGLMKKVFNMPGQPDLVY